MDAPPPFGSICPQNSTAKADPAMFVMLPNAGLDATSPIL
jgi:hypothetical protein